MSEIKLVKSVFENEARIKVIGVGGGGGNAVNRMVEEGIRNVEFVAINTDVKALKSTKVPFKLPIGENTTKGLGAGGKPEIAAQSAVESQEEIKSMLKDADMIFITAGMGGGTGTGAAPVIAKLAREVNQDILSIGVVTKPFEFEGLPKIELAEKGIEEMRKYVDSIIIVPNQRLLDTLPKEITVDEAYREVDNVLKYAVKGIIDVINNSGQINVDFADVKAIMKNSGNSLIGIGISEGDKRHIEAAQKAIRSPLLENSDIHDAKGIIVNISAKRDNFKLAEFEEIMDYVKKNISNDDIKLKFGKVYDETKNNEMQITIIATGFSSRAKKIMPRNIGIKNETEVVEENAHISRNYFNDDLERPAYLRRKKRILN